MLKAENLSYRVAEAELLKTTSLHFQPGQFHVIMGANGAGKSTLLNFLAGDYKPSTGSVSLNGTELRKFTLKDLATKRAVLSQQYLLAFPISVNEIVLMGRYPYFHTHPTKKDKDICKLAMDSMDVSHLADRDYLTLSGGEAQKVQMSRVLAQIGDITSGDKKILFLDEPVSHLDVKFQYQLLRTAKELCTYDTTVIAVLHDINLALSFADRLIFMKKGRVVSDLMDVDHLSTSKIQEVFDIAATIIYTEGNKPVVVF